MNCYEVNSDMSGLTVEQFWFLGSYFYPFYRFVIENYLFKIVKGRHHLLFDAGCGSEISSLSKIPNNITVIGLDINRKSIHSSHQAAKRKGYKNFHYILGSLTHLPLTSDTFDICICIDVLEHIPNKNNVILEISRVCKSKAIFLGSTSNSLNPMLLFDSLAPKVLVKVLTERFAPGHLERHKRLNPKGLIQLLEAHEFNIQNITLFGFPFFQPWLYNYSNRKIPIYAYLWILFDKITNKTMFKIFKETIVFNAIKK
jgi:2-polyprenyl-3-methyl-5-hydroxy-6-metoxy-1,4-benzoquinol methylase